MVESRRSTETGAFQGDIQTLKKKVSEYEKYIKRLKSLVDEEKTEELVDDLSNNQATDVDLGSLMEEIEKVEMEVLEAKRFKVAAN